MWYNTSSIGVFALNKDKKSTVKLIIRLAVIFAVMAVAIIKYDKLSNIDIRNIVVNSPSVALAILSVLGIYGIKGAVFVVPASLVYISVGMAFPTAQAVIINLCGIAVEVTVSYIFGWFVGGEYVNDLLKKSKGGEKLLAFEEKNKFASIFVIRFLPVFPIDFASLFFGSMKIPFAKYFLASVLGIAPRVIFFTILGDAAYDYIPMKLIVIGIICAIPIGAIYLIVKWIKDKKSKEK